MNEQMPGGFANIDVVPRAVRQRLREPLPSKRILVTGGAGFLGSHLCADLLADGHEVLCVDNFFTGRRRNISGLTSHPNFELMRHDVTFPLYVEVDEIYNLACPASPIHYQFDPRSDDEDQRLGSDQHARSRQADTGQDPSSIDV